VIAFSHLVGRLALPYGMGSARPADRLNLSVTGRKPPGVTWESWVDRLVREAGERGEFDDLAGAGKPLPDLDQGRDELWWIKGWLRREGLGVTPPTIAIRVDVERVLGALSTMRSEMAVRSALEALNERIRHVNRTAVSGPPSTTMPLDLDRVVASWRSARAGVQRSDPAGGPVDRVD
jgi:hypothetical protein